MKDKILNKVSPEQALAILKRLAEKNSDIAEQIEVEGKQLLKEVDPEEICEDVYSALDGIEVEELWDRSGSDRYGYSSPEDMALEMIEEELEPHNEEVRRYLELGMTKEAKLCCMGVLKGLYRYVKESESEFKDWAVDIPEECFGDLLTQWKTRAKNKDDISEMNRFLEKECCDWAR
ncbi:hypothetical protein M1O17_03950 [Dehalococcoidia bacterium]|nr:hypothetical protein [Dehalococcoidia bacterium]MCL0076001.1 hypothetical protein [Dehalococcoidia bacterium]